jgi:tripartite-type tricarboxylate transporter receptor subunit TctC
MKVVRTLGLAAALALASATAGFAQTGYPKHVVRMVVPFGPGSATDMLARTISDELSKKWGQQVIVENKPGLAGTTGVAKSSADGYTLMLTSNGHTVAGLINKNIQFDPVNDFAGITTVGTIPLLIVASKEMPAKDLKEFIALAKARPGGYTFASPGLGSTGFLANALFNYDAGVDVVHVPYRSAPDCVTAIIRNDAQIYFAPASVANELVQADRVRAYAVATPARIPLMPDVPTLREAGVTNFVYDPWFAVMAPAGTPAAIIEQINKDIVAILSEPEVKERLAKQGGVTITTSTPRELDQMIKSDTERFAELFAKTGIVEK